MIYPLEIHSVQKLAYQYCSLSRQPSLKPRPPPQMPPGRPTQIPGKRAGRVQQNQRMSHCSEHSPLECTYVGTLGEGFEWHLVSSVVSRWIKERVVSVGRCVIGMMGVSEWVGPQRCD